MLAIYKHRREDSQCNSANKASKDKGPIWKGSQSIVPFAQSAASNNKTLCYKMISYWIQNTSVFLVDF